jgi:hypothetical protein
MWNGFKVIDADAHHHEPQHLWERYVEPKYKDRVPKVIGMRRNFFVYAPDQKFASLESGENIPAHHDQWMADKYGEAYQRWWSPDIRLKDMDRYGWDIRLSSRPTVIASWRLRWKTSRSPSPWRGRITTGAMSMPAPTPRA